MTEATCEGCGASYTTERDPAAPGADTTRCPSCGHKNAIAAADGSGEPSEEEIGASVSVEDGEEVHIHIHIHRE
jgi:DNA-directed RNA polymerase subunit RPC12/RpoP